MKTTSTIALALLALGASAAWLVAQDTSTDDARPPRGQRPPPPVIAVLDANHDGVIDATEIANASAALLTLDKNGDGQLTAEELRPPRPEGQQDGPRPPRSQDQ
jgi:hypothetical protein